MIYLGLESSMQDFELHYQKPPISNMILIVLAIKSMKNQKASAQQIFDFVENTFPFYQDPQKCLRNTLRCTLSASKNFVLSKELSTKELKKQQCGRKGSFWLLNPMKIDEINKILKKHWNTKLKEDLKNLTPNLELVEKLFLSRQCSNDYQKSLIGPKRCKKSPNVQFSMTENFKVLQEFLEFEKESSKETSKESSQEQSLGVPREYSLENTQEYSLACPQDYSLECLQDNSLESPQEYSPDHSLGCPRELSLEVSREYSLKNTQEYSQACPQDYSLECLQDNSLKSPQEYSPDHSLGCPRELSLEIPRECSLENTQEYSQVCPQDYSLECLQGNSLESPQEYSQDHSLEQLQDHNYTRDCFKKLVFMDESLKHDANLENLEFSFGNSDYSSFDAGQSKKPSSKKRAKSFEKEPETLRNGYERPACLNNTHLVILAIKNSPSGLIVVRDIYTFITENFPYFKPLFTKNDEWKRTIRHTLGKEFYRSGAFLADLKVS